MRRFALLLFALLGFACVKLEASPPPPQAAVVWPPIGDAPTLRLPQGVTPLAQQIELDIDPAQKSYKGRTEIEVELTHPTSIIWLNGRGLRVGSAVVRVQGASPMAAKYLEHEASGFASIRTLTSIPAGKARLVLSFSADLPSGDRLGMYRLTLDKQSYVFTQLEPLAARTVFPCFDEPAFKIPFDVALRVPRGVAAVSNGRGLSRRADGRDDRVVFATTAKLPTYLLAFAVGPFDVVEAPAVPPNEVRTSPLPLRLFAPRGRGKDLAHGLGEVAPLLLALEQYTGIGYPYEKLDWIAVPGKNGAMENPGAITIDDDLMTKPTSDARRSESVDIISHELAHMWVGNLVTLAWWDDVWLNEGLATWLGTKAAHAAFPSLGFDRRFRGYTETRLRDDAAPEVPAIREPIRSDQDIADAFGRIVYDKGAAVVAMFERWAGEDSFKRGFRAYLTKYSHANATTADFGGELDAACGKPVAAALSSFLNNRGAPLVVASLRCEAGPAGAHVDLSQTRYSPSWAASQDASTWGIPICVRYGGKVSGETCTFLSERAGVLELPASAGCPDWVLPAGSANGYYRVALASRDWKRLKLRGATALPPEARAIYVASIASEYARGALSYGDALDVFTAGARDDADMGDAATDLLRQAKETLGPDWQPKIEARARALCDPVLRRVGRDALTAEAPGASALRRMAIRCSTIVGRNPELRLEAKQRALAYFDGDDGAAKETTLGSFADVAASVLGEEADTAVYDVLIARASAANDARKAAARLALASARAPAVAALIQRRPRGFEGESADGNTARRAVLGERFRRPDLAAANWDWLMADGATMLAELMTWGQWPLDVVEQLCDDTRIQQAEERVPPLATKAAKDGRSLHRSLARARHCAAARKVHEPEMRVFFQSK